MATMSGSIRRIEAIAVYGRLAATGENKNIKLWNINANESIRTWPATKTYISALYMNDAMVISGSSAGIVKVWDLKSVLTKNSNPVQMLRRISMKGVMHYPIKFIGQISYEDVIIVSKYEAKEACHLKASKVVRCAIATRPRLEHPRRLFCPWHSCTYTDE